jgi:hypothetical protein
MGRIFPGDRPGDRGDHRVGSVSRRHPIGRVGTKSQRTVCNRSPYGVVASRRVDGDGARASAVQAHHPAAPRRPLEESPVPHRRPFLRPLVAAGLIAAGLVALVGGLAIRGPGLVAIGVAGGLAACLGWGTARESTAPTRRSNSEAAVLAAAWTIGLLLVLSGASVLAGGAAAAAVAGAAAVAAVSVWAVRTPKETPPSLPAHGPTAHADRVAPVPPMHPTATPLPAPSPSPGDLPPVASLSTEELGREWLESTALLAGRLDPARRAAIVRLRQEALDELERRDPAGFLRWLSDGPPPDRDPAAYVRGRRPAGESTAGTDAA